MITKIQLQKNATVLAENGKKIGSLERIVVNPETHVIVDLVVRTGGLLSQEEKIVPVELVVETAEDKILLHEDAGELEGFPPLEEMRMVSEHGDQTSESLHENIPTTTYGGFPAVGTPVAAPASKEQVIIRPEQNIPEGTVAMKVGAKVISADDKHIGNVESILAEPFMAQITRIYVSKGLLVKDTNVIPSQWILSMSEDTIHLRRNKAAIEEAEEATIPPTAG